MNMVETHYYIGITMKKCIQINTNMPSIDVVIREIGFLI